MEIAQLAGARLHLVGGKVGLGRAAELLVEDPERAVFTLTGGHKVARREHQVSGCSRRQQDRAGTRGLPIGSLATGGFPVR